MTDELCWQAEEACLNAWPCTRQILFTPWLVRVQGGAVRRVNSVNPIRAKRYDMQSMLRQAAKWYHVRKQPIIVRIPSLVATLDAELTDCGYSTEGKTCTLHAQKIDRPDLTDPEVVLTNQPSVAWMALRYGEVPAEANEYPLFNAMIGAIAAPHTFAAILREGRAVSIAYGVVVAGMLVLEAVATDPDFRRCGYSQRVIERLFGWARDQGASHACLQVVVDNTAALALYRKLGFSRELYRYHYRREPGPG